MKKAFLYLAALLMILPLTSCDGGTETSYEDNSFTQTVDSGNLGFFSLVSPASAAVLDEVPEFSWTASENASYYTLEVASTPNFISNDISVVYYKRDYISTNSAVLSVNLAQRNLTYYWKVTAHVGGKTLTSNNTFTFFLKSVDYDEVVFPIGDTSDWSIHTEGNPMTLSIDNSNFFGNDESSLVQKFEKEQTKQIGWSVVTRTIEKDTYGTDSIFLRFFYSGDDASAYFRVIDNDGEFWRHEIQLSNNSKQTCILPFAEFSQNTQLVTVNNRVFDYFHIKYMELVFERTWGDGVCLVSEVKAVKRSNYSHLYLDKLNFNDYPTETWTWENSYNFGFDISQDGSAYTLKYDSAPNELNAVGFNSKGYAFAKFPVNRFFDTGDMIKVDVKYSGAPGGNACFRIREEDGDFWYYLQPYSTLSTEEFTTIYVPFEAFTASYINGNGKREMSWIMQLQFGVTAMYSSGTLTYKDFEVVSGSEETAIETGPREVGPDGVIENFDTYTNGAQPFYQWNVSKNNKDEFISLDSLKKIGLNNVYAGKMTYKSDMEAAQYSLPLDVTTEGVDALSLWLKDASVKNPNAVFDYLGEISAECYIALTLDTGELYYYAIPAVARLWSEYVIPYAAFTISPTSVGTEPLTAANIVQFGISFSYSYKTAAGVPQPVYSQNNPVFIDNIKFVDTQSAVAVITAKERAITADAGNSSVATIENAESYNSSEDVLGIWSYGNENPSNNLQLSNDVSSLGQNNSLAMNYESYTSVSYAMPTTMDVSIGEVMKPKGLVLDIKGDGKATIYVNIYMLVGSSSSQVRKNIIYPAAAWTKYEIGFDQFVDYQNPSSAVVTASTVNYVYKITFGIVNSDYSQSVIYIDNLRLSNAITRSTYAATPIA
jgi:hypothetical protein